MKNKVTWSPDNTYEYQEGKEAFIKQLIKKLKSGLRNNSDLILGLHT